MERIRFVSNSVTFAVLAAIVVCCILGKDTTMLYWLYITETFAAIIAIITFKIFTAKE